MVRVLRYISLRFWLVCLGALPFGFWLLPEAAKWFPGLPAVLVCVVVCVGFGLVSGWVLDRVGTWRINALIQEGNRWESAGMNSRAEKTYGRAVGVFDSAWISLRAARRIGPVLRDAVGRFYLSSDSTHKGFDQAAVYHVLAHPKDETLALLWLAKTSVTRCDNDAAQAVLTALADAHYANPEICRQLVLIFLASGRTDLSAKRLYRHFIIENHHDQLGKDADILEHIDALIGIPKAKDETEGRWDMGPPYGSAGTLGDFRASADHIPLHTKTKGFESSRQLNWFVSLTQKMGALSVQGAGVVGRGGRGLLSGIAKCVGNKVVRQWVKLGGICAAVIWLGGFAWTTLSHMIESTPAPAQRIEIRIRKPYTIQVAAYLKPIHAQRYVAALKKKGITATIKTTGAGGKTWSLVRVSEFTDKNSAVEYGNQLKSQKIIEDFFVCNK